MAQSHFLNSGGGTATNFAPMAFNIACLSCRVDFGIM